MRSIRIRLPRTLFLRTLLKKGCAELREDQRCRLIDASMLGCSAGADVGGLMVPMGGDQPERRKHDEEILTVTSVVAYIYIET